MGDTTQYTDLPEMQDDQDSREETKSGWRGINDGVGRSVMRFLSCYHGAVPLDLTANPSAANDRFYKYKQQVICGKECTMQGGGERIGINQRSGVA